MTETKLKMAPQARRSSRMSFLAALVSRRDGSGRLIHARPRIMTPSTARSSTRFTVPRSNLPLLGSAWSGNQPNSGDVWGAWGRVGR